MKASSEFGGSITVRASEPKPDEEDLPRKPGAMNLYFGIFPLKVHPAMEMRPFDIGLGYHLSRLTGFDDKGFHIHGPYMEASWYPHVSPISKKSRWNKRFGVHLQPRLLMISNEGYSRYGLATNIKFTAEVTRYLYSNSGSQCDSSGCVTAAWFGEISFGVFAKTGYGFFGKTHFVDIRAGVFINIPVSVGLGFAWWK